MKPLVAILSHAWSHALMPALSGHAAWRWYGRGKDLSRNIDGFVVIVSRTIDLQSETRMFVAETTFVRKFVVEKHGCSL